MPCVFFLHILLCCHEEHTFKSDGENLVVFGKRLKQDIHLDDLVPSFGISGRLESELKSILVPTKAFIWEISNFLAGIAHGEFEIYGSTKLAPIIEPTRVAGV